LGLTKLLLLCGDFLQPTLHGWVVSSWTSWEADAVDCEGLVGGWHLGGVFFEVWAAGVG
jgi:hypothetical protein